MIWHCPRSCSNEPVIQDVKTEANIRTKLAHIKFSGLSMAHRESLEHQLVFGIEAACTGGEST